VSTLALSAQLELLQESEQLLRELRRELDRKNFHLVQTPFIRAQELMPESPLVQAAEIDILIGTKQFVRALDHASYAYADAVDECALMIVVVCGAQRVHCEQFEASGAAVCLRPRLLLLESIC
jgi:hypothetical protein